MTNQLEADLNSTEEQAGQQKPASHSRQRSDQQDADRNTAKGDRSAKPDTKGGIKVKLRDTDKPDGIISGEDLKQELMELSNMISQFPPDTRFKWATFYMTPVDAEGNRIELDAPRNHTLTPKKPAVDGISV